MNINQTGHTFLTIHTESEKTNALLNLKSHQPDIDKIYLYAKELYETKNQLLINKRKGAGEKHFAGSKAFFISISL